MYSKYLSTISRSWLMPTIDVEHEHKYTQAHFTIVRIKLPLTNLMDFGSIEEDQSAIMICLLSSSALLLVSSRSFSPEDRGFKNS